MPLVKSIDFKKSPFLSSGHLQTIVPALFRDIIISHPQQYSIPTPDSDELWLDYYEGTGNTLAILCHGLEGNSTRQYIKGLTRELLKEQAGVIAWNYRGCGPTMNKQLRFYHSGATDDLDTVISHALNYYPQYSKILLCGFSLGGNLVLKYLGENGNRLHTKIKAATVYSVPLDLSAGSKGLDSGWNKVYTQRFLQSLKKKILQKSKSFPDLNTAHLENIRTLMQFDEYYTAPLHGFEGAEAYYKASSALYYLEGISIPVLLFQSADDPMLPPSCYPKTIANSHDHLHLVITNGGGHCGFITQRGLHAPSYAEEFSIQWIKDLGIFI